MNTHAKLTHRKGALAPGHRENGMTTLLVIGFMGIFMLILGSITSYALEQARYGRALLAREQAFDIAESGLDYYRWRISHDTYNNGTIMKTGAGLSALPATYTVNDPEGGAVGTATLTATANTQCGAVQSVDITSKGISNLGTSYPRTITARYMQHNVAEYAFLTNANVWFGSTESSVGPYFANGGIREDGPNNSTVTSALSSFTCDKTMGCTPNQAKPGVFGAGAGSALWQYPASTIDFNGMATNFNTLKSYAQANNRYYQDNTVSANHDSMGFHIILNSDGTFDIYKVTGTTWIYGERSDNNWYADYDIINNDGQTLIGSHVTIPSACALIYVQGTLWLEGTLKGKVTILAADPTGYTPDIILNNNISYATTDGTTGLTAIAAHSIRIPLLVPNNMNIRGIFVAQTGYYGRDLYYPGSTNGNDSYIIRNSLNIVGSIVSYQRSVDTWLYTNGSVGSGFLNHTYSYDRVLAFSPPPFTPVTTADYHFALWNAQ